VDVANGKMYYKTPKIDCKIIDATGGRIWRLQMYVSDEDFGGGNIYQRLRTLRVYTDPTIPYFHEEYGFMPLGGIWHDYTLPAGQSLTDMGFNI